MALATTYLTQTKNLEEILDAIRGAQAPEKFNAKFLSDLGYSSTNDRLIIGVFKALEFVSESGEPTGQYFEYLDKTQSKNVLAQGIREAYTDLFRVNNNANEMSQAEVKQKLKTLTRGTKSDSVLTKMAMTFVTLCKLADFSTTRTTPRPEKPIEETLHKPKAKETIRDLAEKETKFNLAYNIHIELPSTRDQSIYDAIFRSLREHIL